LGCRNADAGVSFLDADAQLWKLQLIKNIEHGQARIPKVKKKWKSIFTTRNISCIFQQHLITKVVMGKYG
jgi:hypothetical protein